ncbi:MAG TPA: hypothetical protein VN802_13855 [Stellaceae bacterium]|nr:hypothetical protein [Stellaceae bacterium]
MKNLRFRKIFLDFHCGGRHNSQYSVATILRVACGVEKAPKRMGCLGIPLNEAISGRVNVTPRLVTAMRGI